MDKLKAEVISYSSVVGGGVLLRDEEGKVIGQLHLVGFTHPAATALQGEITIENAKAFKDAYVAFCERIAAAINAGQPERQVRHARRGSTYDVVASEARFQVSEPSEGLPFATEDPKMRVVTDGDTVTVYRNEHGTFVRFPDEMVAPRFEEVQS